MKKIIYISLIGCLLTTGCKIDNPISTPVDKPFSFENDNIKLELVTSSTPAIVKDIFFFNASTGFIITYDGKVYKSTDNGITWTLKYSNTILNQPFFQILFTDPNVGYVVGGSNSCSGTGCIPPGGLIIKTTDGGNSWTIVYKQQGVEIISISTNSLGDLFAISNGAKGRILKSTNAGINWTTIDSTDVHLVKINFNNDFGFCTGSGGKIIRSTDNGTTWILTTTLTANYITDIKFNNGNGYCIVDNQTVYKTTDNGNLWTQKLNPKYGFFVLNPLTANSCLVFGAGVYSGGDFGIWDGAVTQTKNAGDDWTEMELKGIEQIRYTSFYSATEGYAVAGSKLIKVLVK